MDIKKFLYDLFGIPRPRGKAGVAFFNKGKKVEFLKKKESKDEKDISIVGLIVAGPYITVCIYLGWLISIFFNIHPLMGIFGGLFFGCTSAYWWLIRDEDD